MTKPHSWPDAREVDRIETLVTANDPARVDAFLALCRPGSSWSVQIRTAEVSATVLDRRPLGSFNERDCTCLSLELERPVPVEPGLRLQIIAEDDPSLTASGIIRPWGD
jgi:translation elongation factor EF-Tu-like GTPase